MTRQQMIRVIARTISNDPDNPPEAQARRIADALEAVVAAEIDAAPPAPAPRPAPDTPLSAVGLPPSPAVTEDRPPQRAAAPVDPPPLILPATEIPQPPLPAPVGREPARVYRTSDELRQQLYAGTPTTITVRVAGRKGGTADLTLERNIIMDVGAGGGGAKLSYKLPQSPEGMEAFWYFACTDPTVNLDFALRKIQAEAVRVYSPRERIENTRTFDPSLPMDRAGAIPIGEFRVEPKDFGR